MIAALVKRVKHILFTNSKLTHLLEDSLGGNCNTIMFFNISHEAKSIDDSLHSLRFAAKAKEFQVRKSQITVSIR